MVTHEAIRRDEFVQDNIRVSRERFWLMISAHILLAFTYLIYHLALLTRESDKLQSALYYGNYFTHFKIHQYIRNSLHVAEKAHVVRGTWLDCGSATTIPSGIPEKSFQCQDD
ncbi:hypothetical protein ANN_11451 [Periplaneta americana]|uniref:Uncharacterized protein n=1 Tax=Periplaneta americana TaxID=6978 RepID=A0ABQ8T520_PERAM|nr:hypothetical protein ANN_11451 [Periplaneta americana]